jgi:hypothetical protein
LSVTSWLARGPLGQQIDPLDVGSASYLFATNGGAAICMPSLHALRERGFAIANIRAGHGR